MVLMNDGEHWHYLKRPKRVHMPREVVCLHVNSKRLEPHDKPTRNVSSGFDLVRFADATAVSWRWEKGEQTRYKEEQFRSAKLVIDRLISLSKGGKTVTVFCFNAFDTVNLLRLWDWFDNGTFSFGVNPGGTIGTGTSGKGRKWKGCCILENPPNIVHLRCKHTRGRLKFIGLENYGIRGWTELGCDAPNVIGVYRFVLWYGDFIARHGLGSWCNTSGSQAMHGFRKTYMTRNVLVHRNELILDLERRAYFSGRVECRVLGSVTNYLHSAGASRLNTVQDDKIYCVDVNSMYTHVATNSTVPVSILCHYPSNVSPSVLGYQADVGCIADVTLKTDSPMYPYRLQRYGEKLPIVVFPIGRFRTVLCGPELDLAVEDNHIDIVHEYAAYRLEPLFENWKDFACVARAESNAAKYKFQSSVIKSLLVNLYGKFGQWRYSWERVRGYKNDLNWEVWTEQEKGNKPTAKYRTLGGKTEREKPRMEHDESVPAIAAWVTSLGRVELLHLCRIADWNNVYYMDTDAIWTNSRGVKNLTDYGYEFGTGVGELKIAGEYDSVQFFGLKNYVADGKRVCSGLADDFTIQSSTQAMVQSGVDFEAALSLGKAPEPERARLMRYIGTRYRHGVVLPDYSVTPLRIRE